MNMLLLVTLSIIGLSTAAQLTNTYLPPSSAGSAGGHGGFLQGPAQSPSNQYIPPKTSFNHQGQPVQWSHGGWNAGGAGGQQSSSWQSGQSSSGGGGSYSGGTASGHRYSGSAQSSVNGYGGGAGQSYQPKKPQVPILKLENENDGNGNYHFDYQTGDGTSHQQQGRVNNANTDWAENVVQGQYSYTGDDGKKYTVSYKADGNGFQAVGDHLPTPPPQPREIQEVWNRVLSQQAAAGAGGDWQQGGSYGGSQSGSWQGDSGSWQQGASSSTGLGTKPWQGNSGGHHAGAGAGAGTGTGAGSWQGAGSSSSRPQHGGAAGSTGSFGGGSYGGAGASYGGAGGHGARPQKPQNQYLPPNSVSGGAGYHY